MTFYFGAHFDLTKRSVKECFDIAKSVGCNLIQVNSTKTLSTDVDRFELEKNKLGIVIHSHYFINIAKDIDRSISLITKDIIIARKIGAIGVVVHTGKSVSLDINEAKKNMYNVLISIAENTEEYDTKIYSSNPKIILETSSGQGTETCSDIGDFVKFYKKLKKSKYGNRFIVCVDTCHIFAAGYNIKKKEEIKTFFSYLTKSIGNDQIGLIHLNDSKRDLGSNIDRHDNIGNGFIGKPALKYIFNMFKKIGVPIILETPNRDETLEMEIKYLTSKK